MVAERFGRHGRVSVMSGVLELVRRGLRQGTARRTALAVAGTVRDPGQEILVGCHLIAQRRGFGDEVGFRATLARTSAARREAIKRPLACAVAGAIFLVKPPGRGGGPSHAGESPSRALRQAPPARGDIRAPDPCGVIEHAALAFADHALLLPWLERGGIRCLNRIAVTG